MMYLTIGAGVCVAAMAGIAGYLYKSHTKRSRTKKISETLIDSNKGSEGFMMQSDESFYNTTNPLVALSGTADEV